MRVSDNINPFILNRCENDNRNIYLKMISIEAALVARVRKGYIDHTIMFYHSLMTTMLPKAKHFGNR